MDALLDVNVLVALLWPRHVMHPIAKEWFRHHAEGKGTWATCALTEAGFVRVLSNPAVNEGTLTPLRVTAVLEENRRQKGHRFWAMDLSWPEALRLAGTGIESHQQVTDTYLIGLAVKNKGRMVTFDKALGNVAGHVVVLGQARRTQLPAMPPPGRSIKPSSQTPARAATSKRARPKADASGPR